MEEKIKKIKERNLKLFPIYKMFSWDLLFYYAIVFLFLNQAKGFSASQIFLGDAFYPFFSIIFNFFATSITDKLGKKFSLILGNIIVSFSILLMLFINSFTLLIIVMFWQALGFCFKGICEPTFLSNSATSSNVFLKVNGKGSTIFFIADAISSLTTGFLFVINPYIPIILCFVCCLISTILSFGFQNIPNEDNQEAFKSPKTHFKETLLIYKKVLHSKRLVCLLTFSGFLYAVIATSNTLRSSILVDIGVPDQYFGLIVAFVQVISAYASSKTHWLYKKLGNRTLTYISIPLAALFIISGLAVALNLSYAFSLIFTLPAIYVIGLSKAIYFLVIEKYLNHFTTTEVNTKIFSLNSTIKGIIQTALSIFISFLLTLTNTSHVFIIVGSIYFILFMFLLDIMKSKVGLKPEEYPEEDLVFQKRKN